MKAVEFLKEGERRSANTVRSHWDGVLEEGISFPFEAELGFTQGAPESPLLLIIFYDMIICQLVKQGV